MKRILRDRNSSINVVDLLHTVVSFYIDDDKERMKYGRETAAR